MYGENDNFHLEDSHVIPAIIRKVWEAKINNKPAKIFNANHVNMAIRMPKGENILELNFHPKSFFNYRLLEALTATLLYAILIWILYSRYRKEKITLFGS